MIPMAYNRPSIQGSNYANALLNVLSKEGCWGDFRRRELNFSPALKRVMEDRNKSMRDQKEYEPLTRLAAHRATFTLHQWLHTSQMEQLVSADPSAVDEA